MVLPFKTAALTCAVIVITTIFGLAHATNTYATSEQTGESVVETQTGKVLSFVPICSDASTSLAYWEVTNENTDPVQFTWNNVEHAKTGTFVAVNGTTSFTTYYDGTDPNNRTEFTDPNHDVPVSRNAKAEQCKPVVQPAPICVDGTNPANLDVIKLSQSTYSVKTKGNVALCEDVTLYLSSYILPDNYDGSGFGGPTSYPQQIFGSVSAVLHKDTDGTTTLTVTLPPACKGTQVDLYYAPEITTVGAGGHGGQFIAGELYTKTVETCPGTGGSGETTPPPVVPPTPVTPTTPSTPVVDDTSKPSTGHVLGASAVAPQSIDLPETGPSNQSPFMTALAALVLGGTVYGVVFAVSKKQS